LLQLPTTRLLIQQQHEQHHEQHLASTVAHPGPQPINNLSLSLSLSFIVLQSIQVLDQIASPRPRIEPKPKTTSLYKLLNLLQRPSPPCLHQATSVYSVNYCQYFIHYIIDARRAA
jgi:hypothetical protein